MPDPKWLVAVGAGRWQMSGILAAKNAGINVLTLDGDGDAPGHSISDHSLIVDIRSPSAVVEAVRQSGIKPSGAIAFVNEIGMLGAAALRDHFQLPGASSSIVFALTNKVEQRTIWERTGMPCPQWYGGTDLEQVAEATAKISGGVIVKPADSSGSRGISVIQDGDDPLPALKCALEESRSGQVIVEEFIEGLEYAVETFGFSSSGHQVLAVTEKRKVPGSDDTVAMELATPELSKEVINEIGQLACNALDALGYMTGPGHTEIIRRSDGQLFLVEAAGRSGGFMVNDGIVPRASGFDIARASALQAVGQEISNEMCKRQSVTLRFVPSSPGVVTNISGIQEANALNYVEAGELVSVGQHVGAAKSDGDRLAYILTWADTPQMARKLADKAESIINIQVTA